MPDIGILFVVAVPIGNSEDIGRRAVRILDDVHLVACEDIGRTTRLLIDLQIEPKNKKLVKLFDHNETAQSAKLLQNLLSGTDVVLVSDAGTPVISDPGFELVRLTRQHNVTVVPIPGPSALSTVLSISPIPVNDFRFVGFLKSKRNEAVNQLESMLTSTTTLIFFESRHRILPTLHIIKSCGAGERDLLIARELTKRFEETIFGTVNSIIEELENRSEILGEIVCVLAGDDPTKEAGRIDKALRAFKNEDLKPSTVARVVARITGAARNDVYERILEVSSHPR